MLYGADEVMELTLPLAEALGLEVVGLVDDDPTKQGVVKHGLKAEAPFSLWDVKPDAVHYYATPRRGDSLVSGACAQRIGSVSGIVRGRSTKASIVLSKFRAALST
jgi:hypothetical protein